MTDPIHDADDAFDIALEHHQAGRLAEAEALYRRILELDAGHPGALYLLGGLVYQNGHYEEAFGLVEKAIAEEPDDPDALHLLASITYKLQNYPLAAGFVDRALTLNPDYAQAHSTRADILLAQNQPDAAAAAFLQALRLNPQLVEAHWNLGNIHGAQGQLEEAAIHYQRALAIAPDNAPVHMLLGNTLYAMGKLEAATASYQRVLDLQPAHAQAHNYLGATLKALGHAEQAATSYRRAIAAQPEYVEAHSNLGVVLRDLGQPEEAIACYRRALALKPDAAEIHANLANTLFGRGELEPAIASYLRALELKPEIAELHNYLGQAYTHNRQLDAAIACYERAVALKPDYTVAYSNLGNTLLKHGQVDAAIASYRQALALQPDFAEVHTNLGIALKDCGRLDEAIANFKRAVALKPEYIDGYTNYLVAAQYGANYSPAQLLADHRAFGERVESPWRASWPRYTPRANAAQRLKIGFVSGDFCEHPVGFFLEGALAHIDRQALDIVLYPTVHKADDLTRRLQGLGFAWHPLTELADDQAFERIRADGIDILVDLSGHTADHRLQLFARKPAPVQVAWLGYWATTGLQAMDYILCDPHSVPADETNHFVEQPWYLPDTRLCFTPPHETVELAPLPALAAGQVTFGCFNNLTKMTDAVVAVWSQVLHRVPGSRLLLKSRALADPSTRASVQRRFAAHDIAADRLLLEEQASRRDYLLTYSRVDIALDPFPFTGATTSVEGLWMGVPFITLHGDRLVAHQGEAILHNLELADWIAADAAAYVDLATAKAGDLQNLSVLRASLRARLLASKLCDGPLFARNLQAAFEGMWQRFCDSA